MNPPTPKGSGPPLFKIFKLCLYFILGVIFIILSAGIGFYYYVSKDLPKLDKIEDYRPPVMAEVYDDSGKKIGEFWTEARILTPVEKIPKKLIEAFVSSEDDRFFEHKGVDPYGIVRAFIRNLKAGEVVQGASTITQQVTKALLLSPERTYKRKIREAILATQIERNLNKEQILYIYLNQIYFGNRAYGVAAAARNYFHKTLDELNLAEMAMIAGLAKAPSIFNPVVSPERAQHRMNYVLDRMKDEKYISAAEAEKAKQTPLQIYKAGTDKDFNYHYAPYFVEHVRRFLQKKYGTESLYTSGWKIYTTANLDMAKSAQKAVHDGLEQFSRKFGYRGPLNHLDGAGKITEFLEQVHYGIMEEESKVNYYGDPGLKKMKSSPTPILPEKVYRAVVTGVESQGLKIRIGNTEGLLENKDWTWAKQPAPKATPWKPSVGDVVEVRLKAAKENEKGPLTTAQSFTLYQTPEVESALFSYEPFTGAIKAIVGGKDYHNSEFNRATQALLQPGSSIKPLIYAAALDKGYTPGTIIMDSPIVYEESKGKFWSPKNYGGKYYGPTAFRHALVNSRNVVTVRILMDIGTHYAAGFMRKLGMTTPIYKFYSMALGSNEVKLEELATAYGTFVTGGIRPQTYFVSKIVDPKGNTVEEHVPTKTPYLISYKSIAEKAPENQQAPANPPPATPGPGASPTPHPTSPPLPVAKKRGSWEEMGYNMALLNEADKATKEDDLLLTTYEKKALYGDYIPEGYALTPKTAVTMVSILRDVVRAGTGTRAQALEKPAAGKTGTTNDATDAWFIGFTPNLLTGVWVGFDGKRKSLGRGVTGGGVAAPIWLAYMKDATQGYPTQDFNIPKWVDLSIYEAPIQMVSGVGDAEMGDEGVGTGVAAGPSAGGSSSGAEFFTRDLE
jgi:penicillin-binding protein 1A